MYICVKDFNVFPGCDLQIKAGKIIKESDIEYNCSKDEVCKYYHQLCLGDYKFICILRLISNEFIATKIKIDIA